MTGGGSSIGRRPLAAAGRPWDVVVIGGGIQGAFVLLEAARRGLRALLIERSDFGGETSASSLRIAHGGLRYLQALDVRRFRRSILERAWLRNRFPHLVEELGCLMPLYGEGLRRPSVLRLALQANDLAVALSARAQGNASHWPRSRLLDARATRQVFPDVDEEGLLGGAFWYDGFIRGAPRLPVETIRWSCALGARALNYVECRGIRVRRGRVRGVHAVDRVTGSELSFEAPVVVNATGAEVERLAAAAGADRPGLFHPTLAFNLLLRVSPLSRQGLALAPRGTGSPALFLLPWNGLTLAGTWHEPVSREAGAVTTPDAGAIGRFLEALDRAAPSLGARREDVVRVYAGLLPGEKEGDRFPRRRPRVVDHGPDGGPVGLVSVSGVKYTTARHVAEEAVVAVQRRLAGRGHASGGRPPQARAGRRADGGAPGSSGAGHRGPRAFGRSGPPPLSSAARAMVASRPGELLRTAPSELRPALAEIVRSEAVVRLDDLLLRRTDWGVDPEEGREVAEFIAPLLAELPGVGSGALHEGDRPAGDFSFPAQGGRTANRGGGTRGIDRAAFRRP